MSPELIQFFASIQFLIISCLTAITGILAFRYFQLFRRHLVLHTQLKDISNGSFRLNHKVQEQAETIKQLEDVLRENELAHG